MESHIIFTTAPFEVEDVPLGTLVPDVRYPNQDCLTISAASSKQVSKRPQKNFSGILNSDKHKSFRVQLTKLLTLSASKSKGGNITLTAEEGWIYELLQPKKVFKELCTKDEVRIWLLEGLEGQQHSHFVVGTRTFKNASVVKGTKSTKEVEVAGSAPVGQVIKVNTGVDLGNAADLESKLENTKAENAEESFKTEGELAYAIEYRKIIMKKRQPDAPILSSENIWRYYSDDRTAGEEGGQFEEYEATLSEDTIPATASTSYEGVEDVDGEVLLLPVASEKKAAST